MYNAKKHEFMIKTPKISIIIPIYNVEEYITECLKSVMRQTYKGDIECILVDDCGKDNSISVAEQLIADYTGSIAFRILRHEHNRGLSAARNTGTDATTGDYIYYLDSDDYITDDCIEVLTRPLKEREYDMVVGDYGIDGESEYGYPSLSENEGEIIGDKLIESLLTRRIYVMVWNKLFSLAYLNENHLQFEEGLIHEDEIFTFATTKAIQSAYVLHQKTYYYRVRQSSIMLNDDSIIRQIKYRPVMLCILQNSNFDIQNELHRNYIGTILGDTYAGKLSNPKAFWSYYKRLRKSVNYTPYRWYKQGIYTRKQLKANIHFCLPAFMGLIWLLIRDIKNYKKGK